MSEGIMRRSMQDLHRRYKNYDDDDGGMGASGPMDGITIDGIPVLSRSERMALALMADSKEWTTSMVMDATGKCRSTVFKTLNDLTEKGLARKQKGEVKSEGDRYVLIRQEWMTTEVIDRWTAMLPKRMEHLPGMPSGDEPDPSDNPLTKALAQTNVHIPERSVEGYSMMIKALASLPKGPKEVMDVVDVLIDLCKDRLREARVDCPACGRRVERRGLTGAGCTSKSCSLHETVDGGTWERSLTILTAMARMEAKG